MVESINNNFIMIRNRITYKIPCQEILLLLKRMKMILRPCYPNKSLLNSIKKKSATFYCNERELRGDRRNYRYNEKSNLFDVRDCSTFDDTEVEACLFNNCFRAPIYLRIQPSAEFH